MSAHQQPRVRPLRVRSAVRYTCAGDGLCCTDVHLLGPVSRTEMRRLQVLSPGSVIANEALSANVLKTEGGRCLFLDADDGRCGLHAAHGPEAKPTSCRRFPLRLVATPDGGRVATEHRCPCRTMGDRPVLDVDRAEATLVDAQGRLQADSRVTEVILGRTPGGRPKRAADFAAYAELEAELLTRLLGGEDPLRVLDAQPLPKLDGVTWTDVGHLLRALLDGSACSEALAWFGDLLLEAEGLGARAPRTRPWSPAFDRAERRSVPGSADDIFADFAADAIWSLDWVERGSFAAARAELATRIHIGRLMAERLRSLGVRGDRAAAEAVLVIELVGAAPLWRSVVGSLKSQLR